MIKPNKKRLDPIAFSYLRFSSEIQGKGDSMDRQVESANRWAATHKIEIVERMDDLGLSAFKGDHVRKGQLGDFLDLCKTDDFRDICQARDVYLLVESLDRLSRQKIMTAVGQLGEIIEAGVHVVTLSDGQVYSEGSLDLLGSLIIAVTIMARANEESSLKSSRLLSAHKRKRQRVLDDGLLYTNTIPSWLRSTDDKYAKFELVPECVKIIRRIFKMASEGTPVNRIATIFNQEGIPQLKSFTKGGGGRRGCVGGWYGNTIKRLITSTQVLGTLTFGDHPDEDCIKEVKNYYPRIIDPKLRAKAIRVLNVSNDRGRREKNGDVFYAHIFRKIAFDMEHGDPIYTRIGSKQVKGRKYSEPWFGYVPRDVRNSKRKGKYWRGRDFEALFFATIRLAIQVEGSTMKEEADLALIEEKIAKVQKRMKRIRDLFLDDDEDDDLDLSIFRSDLKELQDQEKALLNDRERIKIKIQAGTGTIQMDPTDKDRERLARVIRSNVERIDMDCEKKRFKVKLLNGIKYEVNTTPTGLVEVVSDDFKTDVFDLHDVKVHRPKSSKIV